MKRLGFSLTLDALLSVMVILLLFIAFSVYRYTDLNKGNEAIFLSLHHISEDALDVLNQMGILDEIGNEWTTDNESGAANLSRYYLDQIIQPNVGYRVLFDDETIAENTRVPEEEASAETFSVRLLAGFAKNKTTLGSVARAFLTGISEKKNYAYAYFGGFVGQGNITVNLHIPEDAVIDEAYMEMNSGDDFDLYVNGVGCDNPHIVSGGYMSANVKEDISGCSFTTGNTTMGIRFRGGDIQDEYIGGGFIRVGYNTTLFNDTATAGSGRYYFPVIDGIINHYSSFYIPGELQEMHVHLAFDNNHTTFFRIGGTLVYNSTGNDSTQVVDLDDDYLREKLDYGELSHKTVPLRLGTSNITEVAEEGNADVILITDLSGSMRWRIGSDSGTGVVRGCDDPNLYNSDTRRISLAKCLDKQFVNIILNGTGNRVGLVGFNSRAYVSHSLSSDNESLITHINNYPNSPSGGTCICCAINRAYNMLNSDSSPDRNKYIIVMSDGITGYCCGRTGWWWWAHCYSHGTSTSGRYLDCSGGSGDCAGSQCDGAIENAVWASQRAHDNLGVTLNSVGFGPVSSCPNGNYTLHQVAEVGNGSYCSSTDPHDLENCYVQFAEDIVEASIHSQVVNLTGSPTNSHLYSSYIDYTYTPTPPELGYGEIFLTYDTERFNDNTTCLGSFLIPSSATVTDLKVTSYSSEHWTDYAHIHNGYGTYVAYRLSDYGDNYFDLGDPYIVNIPAEYVESGANNTVRVTTGDSPDNATSCSVDNRAIITIRIAGSTPYGEVFPEAEGCNWRIEFSDGSYLETPVPESYSGGGRCSYTAGNISYTTGDAVADATLRLLQVLDLDDDGKVDIKFEANQIQLDTTSVGGVRSLWGPARIKLVVWM